MLRVLDVACVDEQQATALRQRAFQHRSGLFTSLLYLELENSS